MFRTLWSLGSIFTIIISATQADIDIKEIGRLLDEASKDEGILLISLEMVVNGIKKTVNEEIYEAEKISEAAGRCAVEVGEQTIKTTEGVMGNYVRDMLDKTEALANVLKNHTATQEDLEDAKKQILAEERKVLVGLEILRDQVLLPEAKRLSKKMDACKELK